MNKTLKHLLMLVVFVMVIVFSTVVSEPIPASAADMAAGSVLTIPSLGIQARVSTAYRFRDNDGYITWDLRKLGTKIAHLEGTGWFSSGNKNIVIGGHYTLDNGKPGAFINLPNVHIGDIIILSQNGVEIQYAVTSMRHVPPTDTSPLAGSATDRITLLTCSGFNAKTNVYTTRLIVVADRVN